MQHNYDDHFMQYTETSRHSAEIVSGLLRRQWTIDSVLDVGCARGTWLSAWRDAGVAQIMGIDGPYVDPETLLIPRNDFVAADLSTNIDLGRTFDVVQSLEVAEHVSASAAEQFVENLVRHSRGVILFSAAPPGQGGEFHVNEQPFDYWREKFQRRGFEAYDYIRPLIANDAAISFWYRYNVLLYAREDIASNLPDAVSRTKIERGRLVPDVSPLAFRARKMFVRILPYPVQHAMARIKAHYFSAHQ